MKRTICRSLGPMLAVFCLGACASLAEDDEFFERIVLDVISEKPYDGCETFTIGDAAYRNIDSCIVRIVEERGRQVITNSWLSDKTPAVALSVLQSSTKGVCTNFSKEVAEVQCTRVFRARLRGITREFPDWFSERGPCRTGSFTIYAKVTDEVRLVVTRVQFSPIVSCS